MVSLIAAVFWSSTLIVGLAYIGYPIVVWNLSRLCQQTSPPRSDELAAPVTLIIVAHNEQAWIADRVRNALALHYPQDKLEILIASDGSIDRTNEFVRGFAQENVHLLAYSQRRGKAATLNAAVSQAGGEIIVLSDANTLFEPDAMARLVRWFADPSVGVVCGRLVLTDAKSGRNVDGIYWRYETFLKNCEGRLGGLLGANGAIYAIRRELYRPIPNNTIVDDFVIPLYSKLQHGFRIVYDPTAIAHEETAPTIGDEFRRRIRIGCGDFQSLAILWPLLHPRHGWTSLTFVCHKLLRWLSPFFLIMAILTNVALVQHPVYGALLGLQLAFYATAVLGIWVRGNNLVSRLVRAASLFCSVNAALLLGFLRWAFTTPSGAWQRTDRDPQVA